MSTEPLGATLPIPEIDTVRPVAEVSDTDHESRTVWLPPIVTLAGVAVNESTVGSGHALAVTVVCIDAEAPQPTVAVSV